MGNAKFTMNSLVIIVIIFSMALFFFTITLADMVNPYGQNDYYPIEGTDLAVKYSRVDPNGIYKGPENTAVLVLEGIYGNDWGTTLAGDDLYLNEYYMTKVGIIVPEIVRVNIDTLEKEVLYKDAMIRGRCASGEMVCLESYILPSNFPKTNSLLKLYTMSDPALRPESDTASIVFIDPDTGEEVFRMDDRQILEKSFTGKYLERSLDEIREEEAA